MLTAEEKARADRLEIPRWLYLCAAIGWSAVVATIAICAVASLLGIPVYFAS